MKMAHNWQIARALENPKLIHGGPIKDTYGWLHLLSGMVHGYNLCSCGHMTKFYWLPLATMETE